MRIVLLIIIYSFPSISIFGQNILDQFNALPVTKEIKAPEFNVKTKYNLFFDEIANAFIIAEENRHSETKELHYNQRIFEIPTKYLSKVSFLVEEDQITKELSLKIALHENVTQIHTYWVSEGDVVSILNLSKLSLGPWEYNEKLKNKLNQIADELGIQYAEVKLAKRNYKMGNTIFKYGSEKAIMTGKKDLDGKLNGDYYFVYAISSPPKFEKQTDLKSSEEAIKRKIEKQLKLNRNDLKGTPMLIYLDERGLVESILIGTNNYKFDVTNIQLDGFQGGVNNGSPAKCKFVMTF